MVAPGIIGLDTMRMLADDDRINLPILSHPTFQGSFNTSPENGISHAVLYGQIARLAGADGSIYPNWGGRFNFSRDECISIVEGTRTPFGAIKPIFPAPGGGLTMTRIPELLEVYERDVIFIMGGGIHKYGPDLVENCRYFRKLVEGI
jgi:ribulose-bisphosphate carboxylase large chain